MSQSRLWKCCEAIAEAAVRAGCRFYAGYPITPQSQIPEYLSWRLPEVGGVFIQAESEVASINMLLGAAVSGIRAMTSSSSPGISLMQEGLSYLGGAELPAVVVNMNRGGPGLGGIQPSQGDYFQSVKGGGHGDYRTIVLAPSNAQEAVDMVFLAFELSHKYRNPALILGDALLSQIMEAVDMPEEWVDPFATERPWALRGCRGRSPRLAKSLFLEMGALTEHNNALAQKYSRMEEEDTRHEEFMLDDAELVLVAYGTAARIAKTAIRWAREQGIPVGMLRPQTLFPFPKAAVSALDAEGRTMLVVEMNTGQMVEDVKALVCRVEVKSLTKPAWYFTPEEILDSIKSLVKAC